MKVPVVVCVGLLAYGVAVVEGEVEFVRVKCVLSPATVDFVCSRERDSFYGGAHCPTHTHTPTHTPSALSHCYFLFPFRVGLVHCVSFVHSMYSEISGCLYLNFADSNVRFYLVIKDFPYLARV